MTCVRWRYCRIRQSREHCLRSRIRRWKPDASVHGPSTIQPGRITAVQISSNLDYCVAQRHPDRRYRVRRELGILLFCR